MEAFSVHVEGILDENEDSLLHQITHLAMEAHWINHDEDDFYYSFTAQAYITIAGYNDPVHIDEKWLDAMKTVVKIGAPANFKAALEDPEWGEPARTEYNKLVVDSKSAIPVPKELARQQINR